MTKMAVTPICGLNPLKCYLEQAMRLKYKNCFRQYVLVSLLEQ